MTGKFLKAAAIRAVRTLCQSAVAVIGTAGPMQDVNWASVARTAALAAVLSLLNSIATGLPEVE